MPLLTNIGSLARCLPQGPQSELHVVRGAALAWNGDRIAWVGPASDLPEPFRGWPREDAGGRLVVPGLVDCHAHLAFAGWRAAEFEQRLQGRSYLEIAAAGGGINSTVARTRAATSEALLARCRERLRAMAALGVTTVEAKSGYGLTEEHEIRLLEIYRELLGGPGRLVATLLAAHTVPPEYKSCRSDYVELVVERIIPRTAREGLARFCDVFVEESAFTVAEARRILEAGKRHGLRPRLHADQLSSCGGAELAAEGGGVGVSLPFASLYLGVAPLPARKLLEAGVPVAVATDFNPGSAPSYHLPMAMTLACTMQRMTPAEVLKGATIVAARVLGLDGDVGSLEAGKSADFAVIDAESVEEWLYHLRANACVRTVARGAELWRAA